MGRDPNIADEELQALLDGCPAASIDLPRFVDDLRATFPAVAPAKAAHLAAIMETARFTADNGDPVVRPASNADAPAPQVSRLPKRREHYVKERKLRIALRVAAPLVALFTVLGIMGSAGALPRSLQRMTSHAAGVIGFDLPSGEDTEGDTADDQGENLDDQGEDTKDDTGDVSQDDQGENDDSQGDSTDTTEGDQGDDSQGDSTDTTEGDQGENDDSQGDSTSTDPTNQDDQGENDQGSTTNEDDQGDNSQDDTSTSDGSNQDDQGDSTSGDSGDSGSGSGDNNQD